MRLSGSLTTKSMSLNNEQCETRSALFDLNSVELNCYPFIINVDKCNKTCNTLTKISGRICVPHETEELNLILINMITRKQELITLKKHIPCKYHCKFDGTTCNSIKSGIMINVNVSAKMQEKMFMKNVIFGILPNAVMKMLDVLKE